MPDTLFHAVPLDRRPILIAVAGPNGAGKTSFSRTYLQDLGLPFVNADDLAKVLQIDEYEAAALAAAYRRQLVDEKDSFIFETVFSDPVGEKLAFLADA